MPPKRKSESTKTAPKKGATKAKPKAKKGKKAKLESLSPDALMKIINDQMGEGTMKFASDPSLKIERIPTGILALDYATGGGFARNRYVELFGSSAVGKNYIAYTYIATAQRLGLNCAFIDCEGKFDPKFAKACGVKLKKLAFHEQVHGNKAVDFMEALLYSGVYDVIILDSIAALLPEPERDSDMSAGSYGTEQARLMSKALRKLTVANKRTSIVMLNQQRQAIGVVYGKQTIEPGGRAKEHYSALRIEVSRSENIKRKGSKIDTKTSKKAAGESNIVVGHRVLIRIMKDQTGGSKPYEESTFVFSYTKSRHDHYEDLIYVGRVLGLVGVNSSDKWWVYGNDEPEMVHTRKRFKKWLRNNPDVCEELERNIVQGIINKRQPDTDEDDE